MAVNYNRYQKRKLGPSDPARPRQFQFPVGNAKLLELYTKVAEVPVGFPSNFQACGKRTPLANLGIKIQ